jgi:hypothetical protein
LGAATWREISSSEVRLGVSLRKIARNHPVATVHLVRRIVQKSDRPKFFEKMAPQPGFEPGTLRLRGGKRNVSRTLRPCAGRCRILLWHSVELRFLPFALCRRLLAFAALWCAQRARKGQPPRHRLNRPRLRGSKRLPPSEAWKTGVVAVGSDPLAPRFDSQRGQPRILHQVPRRTRLPT